MRAWRRRGTIARAFLVLSMHLWLAGVVFADPESVSIDYQGPPGCADGAAFLRALQARTTRFRLAAADEQARRFSVRVATAGAAFAGRLEIRGLDGRSATRTVDGAICDEVADALALMTALAIDPNALTMAPKVGASGSGHPPQKAADQVEPQRLTPEVSADAAGAAPPAQSAAHPWRWSAGLLGHLTSWVSPGLGYGGQLFIEAEAPVSSKLGPAVRAGIFLNQSDVELSTGAGARFQWALAMVEGCPVRLAVLGQRLAVHPCLSLRFGALRGEGRSISQPEQTVGFWADAGLGLRVRVAVTARLNLEAQGALLAPLYRPTFEITDMGARTTAYSVPRIGGLLGMGLSYRFR